MVVTANEANYKIPFGSTDNLNLFDGFGDSGTLITLSKSQTASFVGMLWNPTCFVGGVWFFNL